MLGRVAQPKPVRASYLPTIRKVDRRNKHGLHTCMINMPSPKELFDLRGKEALVTGGATGLGRMIAEALLWGGASVTITSRKLDALAQTAQQLSEIGPCHYLAADLSTPEGVATLSKNYRDQRQQLDILINNSGKTWGAPIESFPDRAWPSVMAVNVQAPFKLIQELLPTLAARASADDPARIINIGSAAGKIVEPIEAYSYTASKAAIHHLSRQLAAELASRHITVNALIPGYFATSMTAHLRNEDGEPQGVLQGHIPLGRFGRASDIAGAVLFLASRAGSYVTATELTVDGGLTGCR
jgi:NAD(P)-dependent dehydrogenase (short-subunit alcohol dehydrogenase family)